VARWTPPPAPQPFLDRSGFDEPADRYCDGRAPGRNAQPLTDLRHPPPHSASRHREPTVSPDGRTLACDACEAETCAASHCGHAVGGMRHTLISYPKAFGRISSHLACAAPGLAALRALGAAMSNDAPSQGAGLITGGQALLEVADLVPCGEVSALRGEIASRCLHRPAGGRSHATQATCHHCVQGPSQAGHQSHAPQGQGVERVVVEGALPSCVVRFDAVGGSVVGAHWWSAIWVRWGVSAGVDESCAMPRWLTWHGDDGFAGPAVHRRAGRVRSIVGGARSSPRSPLSHRLARSGRLGVLVPRLLSARREGCVLTTSILAATSPSLGSVAAGDGLCPSSLADSRPRARRASKSVQLLTRGDGGGGGGWGGMHAATAAVRRRCRR
jgi:hypothetical protein